MPLPKLTYAEIHERADAKRERLLRWVRDESFIDATVAAALLAASPRTASRTLAALVQADLLRLHLVDGRPIWIMTPRGALESWREGDDPTDTGFDGRIAESTLRHAIACQRARLRAEAAGWAAWRSDKQIRREAAALLEAKQPTPWLRQPDALATTPGGLTVAVEVERSPKTSKQYAQIMAGYLQMRRAGTIDEVHYLAESQRLADRLAGLCAGIKSLTIRGTAIALRPEHHCVFRFFHLDTWPERTLL